jgi:hypothetical protein
MLRKTAIALFAVASIGILAPDVALARGGGGGGGGGHGGGGFGGGHGGGFGGGHGGFGGGFHGGGFHGGGFRGRGIGLGFGGLYGAYDYYGDYGYPYYAYDQPYSDSYYGDGGCYVVRRRVHTPAGWRVRPVQVCG